MVTMQQPPPPGPPPPRPSRLRYLAILAAMVVGLAGYAGYTLGNRGDPVVQRPTGFDFPSDGSRSGSPTSIDAHAIADRLDDSIVNITTRLSTGELAAGSGVIISSDGLVLTNNHVIADTVGLRAENSANGSVHTAKVLGYDLGADVALIKLDGVSGLRPATIGNASSVRIDDEVAGLGNAGGQGGSPSVATGRVTALDQRITASDTDGSSERLSGLIQMDAPIQPGDSGGPLVTKDGKVVGIDVAASQSDPRFPFSGGQSGQGYAIPIQRALESVRHIRTGSGGDGIHVGATRGVLGVGVSDSRYSDDQGAPVSRISAGSGADDAGIQQGDLITAVNGTDVSSAAELPRIMAPFQARDRVRVTWVDELGDTHHATIALQSAPPS
jgi:S1-C subfamily serine protease